MARSSVGVFEALGGDISIKVGISPNPEQIKSQLMVAAGNLENTLKPMLVSREAAIDDIQSHFDSESDPDGIGWVELDADYLKYKTAHGMASEILRATGALEAAATSDEAFIVTANGLWFNWDAMPKIEHDNSDSGKGNLGILMQQGTGKVHHVETTMTTSTGQTHTVKTHYVEGEGRGGSLPPRPFVGMSQDMPAVFTEIFDVWFDAAIEVVVHPKTGVMQELVRTPSGPRFGKRINF